jgi:hypothetical protein
MNRVFKRLEINSNELDDVNTQQIAYIKDLNCFVYRNSNGELSFYEHNEAFASAIEESSIRQLQEKKNFNPEKLEKMMGRLHFGLADL